MRPDVIEAVFAFVSGYIAACYQNGQGEFPDFEECQDEAFRFCSVGPVGLGSESITDVYESVQSAFRWDHIRAFGHEPDLEAGPDQGGAYPPLDRVESTTIAIDPDLAEPESQDMPDSPDFATAEPEGELPPDWRYGEDTDPAPEPPMEDGN